MNEWMNIEIVDIRKQEEVLQESYMMIPDSRRRLEAAIDDLREIKVSIYNWGSLVIIV